MFLALRRNVDRWPTSWSPALPTVGSNVRIKMRYAALRIFVTTGRRPIGSTETIERLVGGGFKHLCTPFLQRREEAWRRVRLVPRSGTPLPRRDDDSGHMACFGRSVVYWMRKMQHLEVGAAVNNVSGIPEIGSVTRSGVSTVTTCNSNHLLCCKYSLSRPLQSIGYHLQPTIDVDGEVI
jgi:hypothetical protein